MLLLYNHERKTDKLFIQTFLIQFSCVTFEEQFMNLLGIIYSVMERIIYNLNSTTNCANTEFSVIKTPRRNENSTSISIKLRKVHTHTISFTCGRPSTPMQQRCISSPVCKSDEITARWRQIAKTYSDRFYWYRCRVRLHWLTSRNQREIPLPAIKTKPVKIKINIIIYNTIDLHRKR